MFLIFEIFLLYLKPLSALGLSTSFTEVVVENLNPGNIYSVGERTGQLLRIGNRSARSVHLRIEVIIPKSKELAADYEVIPDTSWITVDRTEFTLNPGETVETDVKIKIPQNSRLWGKRFQTRIWSYTLIPQGGIGVGLSSNLYLIVNKYKPKWWEKMLGIFFLPKK